MGDMSKESGDFSLGVVGGTTLAELRIRFGSIQEGTTGVEVPPGASPSGLANYTIEEIRRHNTRNRNTVTAAAGGRIARPCLAPTPTVGIPRPAVPPLAATQTGGAAAVLGQHGSREGSGKDSDEKDCYDQV